jgi:hypothetical protein
MKPALSLTLYAYVQITRASGSWNDSSIGSFFALSRPLQWYVLTPLSPDGIFNNELLDLPFHHLDSIVSYKSLTLAKDQGV